MTLSAANPFEEYTIVDSDAPLAFPYPWEFADELLVTENSLTLEIGTHYTLTGTGAPGGGQVNPVNALLGSKWRIYRMTRLDQGTTPTDQAVGFALDRLTKQAQDARRDIDRSVKSEGDEEIVALPAPVAGKALVGNADATGYELSSTSIEPKFTSLDAQIAGLAAADAAEIVARNEADGLLAADIIDEANTRLASDIAETNARIAADDALMVLISGGTASPEDVKDYLGLDQVSNTSDADKPISTAADARFDIVEADVAGVVADLDALVITVGNHSSDIIALDGRLDTAETGITGLDARLDTAEPEIDALQAADTAFDVRIDALEAGVIASIKTTVFTANGTFTPDAKMLFCDIEAWGGGGGGGGAVATPAGQMSVGAGGNAGAYVRNIFTPAQIGASKAVTIGAGGTGSAGANGTAGGDTILAGLLTAIHGSPGGFSGAVAFASTFTQPNNAALGNSTGGLFSNADMRGRPGIALAATHLGGDGGATSLGGSGQGGYANTGTGVAGGNGRSNSGCGGGGAANGASQAARAGGNGGAGLMIIREYLKP